MCGICGKYNFGSGAGVGREELKKMNDLLVHRGPDDEGYFIDADFGFAMRRLSIIDLSTGHQPISNEDETIWVVFNGEIYNFQDLREDLLKKGHKFRTKTDTEVLVHLYEEKGKDFVKDLRGMFAIALWDKNRRRLVLARDRIGKKPLFYAVNSKYIAFASELRALLTMPDIEREIDLTAVDSYLTLQYIPSPMTIFKSIKKLEPASILIAEKAGHTVEKYWDLPVNEPELKISFDEAKQRIYEILLEAVKIRMISDVPLGAFLSGGIDSSIVAGLMSRISPEPVKTFTIGFKELEFSELDYAREAAERYGTKHTEFIVEAKMTDILPKLVWHYSEPYADSSALPSYYVSKETRKSVTVALNGDGGDENFAGYHRYIAMKAAGWWTLLPERARILAAGLMASFPDRNAPFGAVWRAKRFLSATLAKDLPMIHLAASAYFRPDEKDGVYSHKFADGLKFPSNNVEKYFAEIFEKARNQDMVNKLLYADFRTYLPECLMTKMDIASMANSLETRSPFLDHKLIEFVYRLPGKFKLRGFSKTKWILKETFKDFLPHKIYKRGKQGFGIPVGPWFRGELKDYWASICLGEKAVKRGYFKKESLERIFTEHQTRKRDHGYRMWALLMLELWHRQFADDFKI
ncbi:MAG: asparagine synthase (glutamine-hydrolyzing) [Elusimicrobia bacterium]|nr:asparagine synthase (glutamine-hydrolyzing) [Elusimicrobiota bacterium]